MKAKPRRKHVANYCPLCKQKAKRTPYYDKHDEIESYKAYYCSACNLYFEMPRRKEDHARHERKDIYDREMPTL